MNDTYISLDVEVDGPWVSPGGFNSIRQIGGVACSYDGLELGRYIWNLAPLPGNVEDHDTVENFFKRDNPEAWRSITERPADPGDATRVLLVWITDMNKLNNKGGVPILVLWGTAQDYPRLNAYTLHFCKTLLNSFDAIDLKSFAAGKLNMPYSAMGKNGELSTYRPTFDTSYGVQHTALADACNQAQWFFNVLHGRKLRELEKK